MEVLVRTIVQRMADDQGCRGEQERVEKNGDLGSVHELVRNPPSMHINNPLNLCPFSHSFRVMVWVSIPDTAYPNKIFMRGVGCWSHANAGSKYRQPRCQIIDIIPTLGS